MSAIYFGKPPACPTCKETPGLEYMKRSRYTSEILCDLCVPFDLYSNEWYYYAEEGK